MKLSEPEVWLPIPLYEGLYEVSSLGRVRSLDRIVDRRGCPMNISGIFMKPVAHHKTGYLQIVLSKKSKRKTVGINVIVCEAFNGPRPLGAHAAHEDGVFLNNRASNLSWKTVLENDADKDRHGTRMKGESSATAKMVEADVIKIVRLRKCGMSYKAISKKLSITFDMARMVCAGRSWRHIEEVRNAF